MKKNYLDPAVFTPRWLVIFLAKWLRSCMRIDHKYDMITYVELCEFIDFNEETNKGKN